LGERNYRMTVAYDGTAYRGFQIQVGHPTIQGELEGALARLTGQPVRAHGAGRTDAGVHAQGQVISFRASWRHPTEDLERGMNALLPADIAVRETRAAPEHFHARFSAVSREYLYTCYIAPMRDPLLDRYAYRLAQPPDWGAIDRATRTLVTETDFAAFGQAPTGEGTIRKVIQADWRPRGLPWPEGQATQVREFHIAANGFLRGMVRRIVGTLIAVGQGSLDAQAFQEILAARDIGRASPPAPACGLMLWRVNYEPKDESVAGGIA
jgi:tRNA pseudouridine38-40 synthase